MSSRIGAFSAQAAQDALCSRLNLRAPRGKTGAGFDARRERGGGTGAALTRRFRALVSACHLRRVDYRLDKQA